MKMFTKKNQLDEMQEQKLRKIESRGFWWTWGALLAAFLVQSAMGTPPAQWAAEWVIFMGMSVYGAIMCIVNGIWDRHTVAGTPSNAIWSLVGGGGLALYVWVRTRYWPGALISGAFTGLLCFAALQITAALYRRRRKSLDREETDPREEQ